MVSIVKGNLLDAKEAVIAHQVNCQKKMNSGVAKAIREKYPEVFVEYLKTEPQLGNVGFVFVPTDKLTGNGITIANMYAQDMYGYDGQQYTNYDAFRTCCRHIVSKCRYLEKCINKKSPYFDTDVYIKYDVAMPYKIASDRGGADWDKIMDILLEEFTDINLTLYKI
jgi:O-acetyl-ADP-ribose deacetylase (regulator of RNase III)